MTPDAVRALIREELSRFVDRLIPLLSPCSDAAEYNQRVQLLRGAVAPDLLTEEEAREAIGAMPLQGFASDKPNPEREDWHPVGDSAFAPPFGTVCACIDCGCLIAGGPTRCAHCVSRAEPGDTQPTEPPEQWETVLGSELREGDTLFYCGTRLQLERVTASGDAPSGPWREFWTPQHTFFVYHDQRFERLVRPEPKPARPDWATPEAVEWLRDVATGRVGCLSFTMGTEAAATELQRRILPAGDVAREMLAELEGRDG